MADWIHCNKCFKRYRSNIQFYVTTCGHLHCENCISQIRERGNKCLVCDQICQPYSVSNSLQPELQRFFRSPAEAIKSLEQICTFQTNNMMSLLKYVAKQYNHAKMENFKLYRKFEEASKKFEEQNKIIEQQNKEIYKLKEMLKFYGRKFGSGAHVMPGISPVLPSAMGTSTSSTPLGQKIGFARSWNMPSMPSKLSPMSTGQSSFFPTSQDNTFSETPVNCNRRFNFNRKMI